MTETLGSGRSVRKRSRLFRLNDRRRRFLIVCVILAGAIAAYFAGLRFAYRDMADAKRLVEQLQSESQRLKTELAQQNAGMVALQAKAKSAQAALDEIMPSENTYKISPNQSVIVAGGRLTVGLIGSPTNETVNININGKQQSAATGDVITVATDPPCQVRVQSFDMFKVVVTASCVATRPR